MPQIEHITPNENLPPHADVVVIGAGIAGIATALELRERGHSVVVVEKGEVAAEQSSRNWGWVRQMGRDSREIPLVLESLKLWHGMNARVHGETGFRQCGIAYLAETDAQMAEKEKWVRENAVPYGLATKLIGSEEVDKLLPGSMINWKGAMYTANDCRAEPFLAVPAMARGLQATGGQIFTQCAARGLETSAGRVSAVVTERGVITTDTVVLAAGYWSRRFLFNHSINFPQLGVVNSVMRTTPIDVGHTTTFSGNTFTARKRKDGCYTVTHNHFSVADIVPDTLRLFTKFLPIFMLDHKGLKLRLGQRFVAEARLARRWALDEVSPFEQVRILDPEPIHWILDDAEAALKKAFPAFAPFKSAERWGGVIDATPDAVPVIDALAKIPGLFMASGFSGHGFGIGPGAGKLMAQIVTGEAPCVDPTPFKFNRFEDGSRPRPTTGL
ncbi:MAG: FAD-binding oxidoreductase [Alphaproteobacteria bacterium]|nr:FAD-binding oxidoreductase [Alphaproteobacteria bacterium]